VRLLKLVLTPVLALAGLVLLAPAASAAPNSVLAATLSGANEVPAIDPPSTGTAAVRIDSASGEVCYDVRSTDITAATGMHIHRGAVGVNGPIVVDFNAADLNAGGERCTTATSALASEIAGNPAGFYVNVHTTANPGGAIRGQLATTSTTATLVGAQENPPVPTSATGDVTVRLAGPTSVCANVMATGLTEPAIGMHIHRGAVGVNGPIVVNYNPADIGAGERCVDVAAALVTELSNGPGGFYFNIHTASSPAGLVRGQLAVVVAAPAPAPAPTTPPTTAPAAGGRLPTGVNAGNGGQAAASDDGTTMPFVLGGLAVLGALWMVAVRRRRVEADS
jgi:hypothetical protein